MAGNRLDVEREALAVPLGEAQRASAHRRAYAHTRVRGV